jgi:hypothetical protein
LIPSRTWNLSPHTWYRFVTAPTVFTAHRSMHAQMYT